MPRSASSAIGNSFCLFGDHLQRVSLARRDCGASTECQITLRRESGDATHLVPIGTVAARFRREDRGDGGTCTRGVVLRGPLRQLHHSCWDERPFVQGADEGLDGHIRHSARHSVGMGDDHASHGARADRHDDPSPNRGRRQTRRHAVREQVQGRDRDRNPDEGRHDSGGNDSARRRLTSFMSSQTSRLDAGLRRRNAG